MAIAELVMPKLGESIMEATILKWHKQVGDTVKQDETVLDIATDKVDSEVPSTAEGVISEILFNINDVVPIGTVIARIRTGQEAGNNTHQEPVQPAASAPAPIAAEPAEEAVAVPAVAAPAMAEAYYATPEEPAEIPYTPAPVAEPVALAAKPAANRFYSPLVLNIANSESIPLSELERIPGTGNDGRVSKKDILQYVADKKAGNVPAYTPAAVTENIIPSSPAAKVSTTPAVEIKTAPAIITSSYVPASYWQIF